jgi:hypothetical protein
MAGPVARYLEDDHARIDATLHRALDSSDRIEPEAYAEFRAALLRHISMEEKILLPAARMANGGDPLPQVARLHLDHGALAALLVPTPNKAIIDAIRAILDRHNVIEEGANGVYEKCELLPGFNADAILKRLQSAPPVAMAPHADSPIAFESMRAALHRAGYSFDL